MSLAPFNLKTSHPQAGFCVPGINASLCNHSMLIPISEGGCIAKLMEIQA